MQRWRHSCKSSQLSRKSRRSFFSVRRLLGSRQVVTQCLCQLKRIVLYLASFPLWGIKREHRPAQSKLSICDGDHPKTNKNNKAGTTKRPNPLCTTWRSLLDQQQALCRGVQCKHNKLNRKGETELRKSRRSLEAFSHQQRDARASLEVILRLRHFKGKSVQNRKPQSRPVVRPSNFGIVIFFTLAPLGLFWWFLFVFSVCFCCGWSAWYMTVSYVLHGADTMSLAFHWLLLFCFGCGGCWCFFCFVFDFCLGWRVVFCFSHYISGTTSHDLNVIMRTWSLSQY